MLKRNILAKDSIGNRRYISNVTIDKSLSNTILKYKQLITSRRFKELISTRYLYRSIQWTIGRWDARAKVNEDVYTQM